MATPHITPHHHHATSPAKKRVLKIALLIIAGIAISVLGFSLGRGTGENDATSPTDTTATPDKPWSILPSPPKDTGEPTQLEDKTIIIESPAEKSAVPRSFTVTGRAKREQNTLTATLKDAKGNILTNTTTTLVRSGDTKEQFARFTFSLSSGSYQGKATLTIEGTTADAKVTRELTIADPDTINVNIFVGKKSNNSQDCEAVSPLSRSISGKGAVYREVIEALLRGITPSEEVLGYFTSLPSNVRLKSIAADANGIVTVEFDESLERGVAGSCRVMAIRSQITATLKQFPEVRDVIIMVNGRVDDVLQP